jgi:uncharacterized membrane protein YdbT with pleckstrin-like domain
MPPDNSHDLDYPTKQSPGYMFLRLFVLQVIFIIYCMVAVLLPEPYPDIASIPGLYISAFDIIMILLGIIGNFIVLVLIFVTWQYNEYRISSKELNIKRSFLLIRTNASVSISSVQHAVMQITLAGRLLNYATIYVYTSESDRPIRLYGVPFAEHFLAYLKAQTLLSRHRENKRRSKRSVASAQVSPAA